MSEFFESEMVKATMKELEEMQDTLLMNVLDVPYFSKENKKKYIQLMREFLEKQKVLLFRMSLSDDPEAQLTKKQILESAKMFGLKDDQNLDDFYKMLEKPIKELEKSFNI